MGVLGTLELLAVQKTGHRQVGWQLPALCLHQSTVYVSHKKHGANKETSVESSILQNTADYTMKILWVCLLLATLLIVVQGRGRGGGGRGGGGRGGGWSSGRSSGRSSSGWSGRSSGRSSSSRGFKKNLKKAAIVGAVAYGTYQV